MLITHGPPVGHGDRCSGANRAGCVDLLREIQTRIKPRFHVFGHIHGKITQQPRSEPSSEKLSLLPLECECVQMHMYASLSLSLPPPNHKPFIPPPQHTHTYPSITIEGFGVTTDGQTKYVNASTCTFHYAPTNPAIVFDIPLPGHTAEQGNKGGADNDDDDDDDGADNGHERESKQ